MGSAKIYKIYVGFVFNSTKEFYVLQVKKERGKVLMRRSIKKAVAFTLAAVTMFANLSITSPVKAAEYDEVKEIA